MTLVDQIDVANLDSEARHDYRWWQDETPPGFVTEVYRHTSISLRAGDEADCWATDGGRVLTGGEEFTAEDHPRRRCAAGDARAWADERAADRLCE